jgi:hypothetical protein
MFAMSVVHLVIVLLLGSGETLAKAREFPSVEACKAAEADAHEASKQAGDVVDVGTLCVKSEFNPDIKPRA